MFREKGAKLFAKNASVAYEDRLEIASDALNNNFVKTFIHPVCSAGVVLLDLLRFNPRQNFKDAQWLRDLEDSGGEVTMQ